MTWLGPNQNLIGEKCARERLLTPALVLDLDIFEHNLKVMADRFRDRSVKLRPHAKTHKCAEIARRQMDAGAVGVCVAKLGEACALHARGIERMLITSPVVTAGKIERLLDLNDEAGELLLAVDNGNVVAALAAAATRRRKPLHVVVDLGVEDNRTGAATIEGAAALSPNRSPVTPP